MSLCRCGCGNKAKAGKTYIWGHNVALNRPLHWSKEDRWKLSHPKYELKNDKFFELIDTESKAYWLGFMFADGCIIRRPYGVSGIQVGLNIKDKNHLEKFKKDLGSNHPLYEKGKKLTPFGVCDMIYLCVARVGLAQQLISHGCIPNKTLVLKYPNRSSLPEELDRHFIRGYFDADGCISCSDTGTGTVKYMFNIAGVSEEFLIKIRSILVDNVGVNRIELLRDNRCGGVNGNHDMFTLKYSGNAQVSAIRAWLYKDATIFLDRKRDKFFEAVVHYKKYNERYNVVTTTGSGGGL
jgi:hypothetical protein